MNDLVANWQVLSTKKHENSYCSFTVTTIKPSNCEVALYLEIPILNPEAQNECDKINSSIIAAFKRAMAIQNETPAFENGLRLTNEELSKLLTQGSKYTSRLSSAIIVKYNKQIFTSSCGRAFIWLFRDGKHIDLSEKNPKPHPLKIFENYSEGTLEKDDSLLVSSDKTFEHINREEIIKNLQLKEASWLEEKLSLLNQEDHAEITLAACIVQTHVISSAKMVTFKKASFPTISLKNIQTKAILQNSFQTIKSLKWDLIKKHIEQYLSKTHKTKNLQRKENKTQSLNIHSALSNKKRNNNFKFLIIGIVILLCFLAYLWYQNEVTKKLNTSLYEIKLVKISLNHLLSYKINTKNQRQTLNEIEQKAKKLVGKNTEQNNLIADITKLIEKTKETSDQSVTPKTTELDQYSQASNMIKLPFEIGVISEGKLIKVSKLSGKRIEKETAIQANTENITFINQNKAILYDGQTLQTVDHNTGQTLSTFTSNVPAAHEFGGLSVHNNKVYIVNKSTNSLLAFPTLESGLIDKPDTINEASVFQDCIDLYQDTTSYCLTPTSLNIINQKQVRTAKLDNFFESFSGSGKVQAQSQFIYILDRGNNRIIILDKQLTLNKTLHLQTKSELVDFFVDEKGGVGYVLTNKELLKIDLQ